MTGNNECRGELRSPEKFSLYPKHIFQTLTDITPEFLKTQGISFLMLDLDNTIAPYGQPEPPETILQWAQRLRDGGISLYIISNSKREHRVAAFAKALGVSFCMNARKPSPGGLLLAMGLANVSPEAAALVGDQIFTDVLAANRAGVTAILVQPIRLVNPFHTIRYFIELPFRKVR